MEILKISHEIKKSIKKNQNNIWTETFLTSETNNSRNTFERKL